MPHHPPSNLHSSNWSSLCSSLPLALALLVGSVSASTLTGCALSAEASAPDIEITEHNIAVTGIPMAGRVGEVATQLSFMENLPSIDLPASVDSSVKAVGVTLTAKQGVTDLAFLHSLRVVMAPTTGTAAPVELITYEKSGSAAVGTVLAIPSQNPANILDEWKAKTAEFTVEVSGVLPEQSWMIDLSVHFAGDFSYHL